MPRYHLAIVILLSLLSCGKPSGPDTIRTDRGYTIAFEDAWVAIVEAKYADAYWAVGEAVQRLGWTIRLSNEKTGDMVTDDIEIGSNRDPYACDVWFRHEAAVLDEVRCTLEINVVPMSQTLTKITANAKIRGKFITTGPGGGGIGWLDCVSTGKIEGEFFDAVLGEFEPLRYDPPVYRRKSRARQ